MIWLRASEERTGEGYDLASINGELADDGGIVDGRLLVRFAEAMLGADDDDLSAVRAELVHAAGPAAFVDAAAVVALFNAIDRVADATGTPLEPTKIEESADFRPGLGIDGYYSVAGKI